MKSQPSESTDASAAVAGNARYSTVRTKKVVSGTSEIQNRQLAWKNATVHGTVVSKSSNSRCSPLRRAASSHGRPPRPPRQVWRWGRWNRGAILPRHARCGRQVLVKACYNRRHRPQTVALGVWCGWWGAGGGGVGWGGEGWRMGQVGRAGVRGSAWCGGSPLRAVVNVHG